MKRGYFRVKPDIQYLTNAQMNIYAYITIQLNDCFSNVPKEAQHKTCKEQHNTLYRLTKELGTPKPIFAQR